MRRDDVVSSTIVADFWECTYQKKIEPLGVHRNQEPAERSSIVYISPKHRTRKPCGAGCFESPFGFCGGRLALCVNIGVDVNGSYVPSFIIFLRLLLCGLSHLQIEGMLFPCLCPSHVHDLVISNATEEFHGQKYLPLLSSDRDRWILAPWTTHT